MSLFADALQSELASGILEISGPNNETTIEHLISGRGQGCYASIDPSGTMWQLDFAQAGRLSPFLAWESARFATAAFQSFSSVSIDAPQAERFPWALVMAYYGAFYAGHSLLRVTGSTCTYVKDDLLAKLRGIFTLYGIRQQFASGLYLTRSDPLGAVLSLESLSVQGGGTHEGFWKVLVKRLQEFERAIMSGPMPKADAQKVWATLTSVRSILSRDGGRGCWLSAVRNEIQYQHKRGVWHSCELNAAERRSVARLAGSWQRDPLSLGADLGTASELGAYVAACTFLVAACHSLVMRIEHIAAGRERRSFVSAGPLRFARHVAQSSAR